MSLLNGCDISIWQPEVDFVKMSERLDFVYIKAVNGIREISTFQKHWTGAGATHIKRGAYGYFLASHDPLVQARVLVNLTRDNPGSQPLAFDFEFNTVDGWANHPSRFKDYAVRCYTCLTEIKRLTGDAAMYTNPSFIRTYFQRTEFTEFKLWIANPGDVAPTVPMPWLDWWCWQKSWKGFDIGASERKRAPKGAQLRVGR